MPGDHDQVPVKCKRGSLHGFILGSRWSTWGHPIKTFSIFRSLPPCDHR